MNLSAEEREKIREELKQLYSEVSVVQWQSNNLPACWEDEWYPIEVDQTYRKVRDFCLEHGLTEEDLARIEVEATSLRRVV